jgi:hypothetical protein
MQKSWIVVEIAVRYAGADWLPQRGRLVGEYGLRRNVWLRDHIAI